MHSVYLVLSDGERDKGFVRPVRRAYMHVGPPGPRFPLLELTEEQHERYDEYGYVKYEEYPDEVEGLGRYWTQARLDKVGVGCRVVTYMGQELAETYARQPGFYGSTWCCGCNTHLPVGADGEFVWDGTDEKVGT